MSEKERSMGGRELVHHVLWEIPAPHNYLHMLEVVCDKFNAQMDPIVHILLGVS